MKDLGAIILAGGKSSRMGRDKAFLGFRGRTMLEICLDAVREFTNEISIIGSKEKYRALNLTVFSDIFPDCGPAGGIYTGLTYSKTPKNLVLSCDLPEISASLIATLLDEYNGEDALVMSDPSRVHPLVGIYHKRIIEQLKTALENKEYKMMRILKQFDHRIVDCPENLSHHLRNVNTIDEYNALI